MACADPDCGNDRERKMVLVSETPPICCDPCIAPIIEALNAAGVGTVASCCGHGHRPARITLADGREVYIARDYDDAQQIEAVFPIDINGERRVK